MGPLVVCQSDLVVAVWEGEPGQDGTVDIVRFAAALHLPLIWIYAKNDTPPVLTDSLLDLTQPPAAFGNGHAALGGLPGALLASPVTGQTGRSTGWLWAGEEPWCAGRNPDGRWIHLTLAQGQPRGAERGAAERPTGSSSGEDEVGFHRVAPDPTRGALASAWQALIDHAQTMAGLPSVCIVDTTKQLSVEFDRLGWPALGARLDAVAEGNAQQFLTAAYAMTIARAQTIALPVLTRAR